MARSTRKRQARLEFTPLPSSSPATATYHKQIRDRAAAVGLQGSPHPAKRRKIGHASPRNTLDGGNDEGKQSSFDLEPICKSLTTEDILPTPEASNRPAKALEAPITLDSDSDETLPQLPSRVRKGRQPRQTTLDLTGDGATKSRSSHNFSSPLRKRNSSPGPTPDSGAFFRKGSGHLKSSPLSTGRATRSRRTAMSDSSDDDLPILPARKASDNIIELSGNEDSDESDVLPTTPAKKRRASRKTTTATFSDDDEEELPKSSRLRRGRRKVTFNNEQTTNTVHLDSDSEQDETPRKMSGHVLTQEERQELEDDVNDLKSSSSEDEAPSRSQKTAKSERQLALERLKRRRAGMKETQEEEEPETVDVSDDELEIFEGSDDDVQEIPPSTSAQEMFDADEYDADFLADEGDDTLGAPDGLPLAFTRYASMKPKELFQFIVEWMIQKKLNPGFNMTDEIYDLAFKKLDDEVKGLAGSKFESSAWKQEFIYALRARPDIAKGRITGTEYKDKCDACNRSGHIPTYEVQFQGKPYQPQTLEEVEQQEDSDDENDDDEGTTRDARGSIILPESHSFFVGKHCMANAETAHSLQHWRYHLYEWVVGKLGELGHLTSEKIVQRDGWGEPKRRKFANKVFDQFNAMGLVKELYNDFKAEVENARNVKNGGRWQTSP
ncbi:Hypothetical protein D9617_6g095650 [Elsinoe fawcettii]|nr:Hypothetical protein D9617_6g095650 [Elsinoe fawcettii]